MVSEKPFDLKELFKPMSVWLVSLIYEMRTFAKETPQPSFSSIVPKSNGRSFKKKASELFAKARKLVCLRYKL